MANGLSISVGREIIIAELKKRIETSLIPITLLDDCLGAVPTLKIPAGRENNWL
jgi:hypothetical protein